MLNASSQQLLSQDKKELLNQDKKERSWRANASEVTIAPDGSIFSIPDPENRAEMMKLLFHPQIRMDLELNEAQCEAIELCYAEAKKRIRDLVSSGRNDISALLDLIEEDTSAAIEEILLPAQISRISQLAYRIEIERVGLATALTVGRLSKTVGVYPLQISTLDRKIRKLEMEAETRIIEIRRAFLVESLSLLPREQREKAEKALGDPFQYRDQTDFDLLLERVKKHQENSNLSDENGKKPS